MVIKEVIVTDIKVTGVDKAGNEFAKFKERIKVVGDKTTQTFEKLKDEFGTVGHKVINTNKLVNKSIEDRLKRQKYLRLQERNANAAEKMNILIARAGAQERRRGAKALNDITKNARRFKMELLSVMFFGLGIKRFFQGLLQPALELAGVFELFSTMLSIVFLPVALLLLDVLLPIMDFFIGLPQPVQLIIGTFALLGVIIGSLLFLFGMLGLGLAGLTMAFGALAIPLLIAGGVISAILAVIAVLGIMMVKMGGFKQFWINVWQGIKNIVIIFVEWFKFFMQKGFEWVYIHVWAPIRDIFNLLVIKPVKALWQELVDFIKNLWDSIKDIFFKVVSKIPIVGGVIGSKQSGGYIPQTGLYKLHAGENVIPASQSFTSSPTINVYTTGGVDSFSLNQIQDIIARELASISRR